MYSADSVLSRSANSTQNSNEASLGLIFVDRNIAQLAIRTIKIYQSENGLCSSVANHFNTFPSTANLS
jgi:hypothetical protein